MTVQDLLARLSDLPANTEVWVAVGLNDTVADSVELVDGAVVIS